MSRTKLALALTGATLAGVAVGVATGLMAAPASGTELRRRMAWRLRDERKSLERLWERALDRAGQRKQPEHVRQAARTSVNA